MFPTTIKVLVGFERASTAMIAGSSPFRPIVLLHLVSCNHSTAAVYTPWRPQHRQGTHLKGPVLIRERAWHYIVFPDTRIGSDRGKPQSTITHSIAIQNNQQKNRTIESGPCHYCSPNSSGAMPKLAETKLSQSMHRNILSSDKSTHLLR